MRIVGPKRIFVKGNHENSRTKENYCQVKLWEYSNQKELLSQEIMRIAGHKRIIVKGNYENSRTYENYC